MKIEIELTRYELFLLSLLLNRLYFEHYLSCTDTDCDQDQAYEIMSAALSLKEQLSRQSNETRTNNPDAS